MAATFSITLDKNFRLDTGRKLEKISKSRDGFFSRGDNTAFFMELGIEAELNERFTTLLIIGSKINDRYNNVKEKQVQDQENTVWRRFFSQDQKVKPLRCEKIHLIHM